MKINKEILIEIINNKLEKEKNIDTATIEIDIEIAIQEYFIKFIEKENYKIKDLDWAFDKEIFFKIEKNDIEEKYFIEYFYKDELKKIIDLQIEKVD